MKISLGCDHGGYELKEIVKKHLEDKGFEIIDTGTYSLDSVDYPDYGQKAAECVSKKECEKGIVICTTGIGISISANKVKGVRCALCTNAYMAKMTRLHNDANMLAFGAGIVGKNLALEIVDTFFSTEFEGGRHIRRIEKMMNIENSNI
ncbi:ribose 5-phosphate isomerase B [Sedimentibacter sp. zth1]|uniref:ribose 5-phosphate isomerase B n=1 Tax=Sedimentibacter sp. zth1 TaxID=2816908 RepID=UPI001A935BB1|nr:ribose 5-phosphate isomerase B [Sedimentibacter sp. zth1]QSX05052.1 ribose 5-phosphate isomerase B [Sedimentibacter sp. zth1]